MSTRRSFLALAILVSACAAASRSPPPPRPNQHARARPIPPLGPAHYAITESRSPSWDQAPNDSAPGRITPAIVDGTRLFLDHGIVVASRSGPEPIAGFRSLPDRLGGGLVAWSDERSYRAADLLGDLHPLIDVGATGGVFPWLRGFLLRTELGVFEVDAATGAAKREAPGFVAGIALDSARALSIDRLGRGRSTIDGGRTFTDITLARGLWIEDISELAAAIGVDTTGGPRFVWDGALRPAPPEASPLALYGAPFVAARLERARRSAASESLAHAAVAGALIPGDRIVVASDVGVRVLSASTGDLLVERSLPDVGEAFSHCDPAWIEGEIVFACLHEHGAALLVADAALADVRLEATFPDASVFVAGSGARFGYAGRCGGDPPLVPSAGGGGAGGAMFPDPAPTSRPKVNLRRSRRADSSPDEPPLAVDAGTAGGVLHFCARVEPGRWIERALEGDDVSRFYRWVPGDDGVVTALVLEDPEEVGSAPAPGKIGQAPDGVRVVRLDPHDPALGGATYLPPPAIRKTPPFRAIDRDMAWDDAGAVVRGWVSLPSAGEPAAEPRALTQEGITRTLALAARVGGRLAGIELAPSGRVAVHALPAEITDVVSGGGFALARAEKDDASQTLESTDGGGSWRVVTDPPVGRIASASDDGSGSEARGCSAIGCSWGDGVVRLGWGEGSEASLRPIEAFAPAQAPRPRTLSPLAIRCRFGAPAHRAEGEGAGPGPIGIRSTQGALGAIRGGDWSADVSTPFLPSRSTHRVTLKGLNEGATFGDVVPLLHAAKSNPPVELVFYAEKRRFLLEGGSVPRAFASDDDAVTAFADAPSGELVGFKAATAEVLLVDGARSSTLIRLANPPGSSSARLTLARRLGDGGLAVLGYSTTSGEVFAGPLDLGSAGVGPLSALADLESLAGGASADCANARLTHRFVADLPVTLELSSAPPGGDPAEALTASALIESGAERACLVGLEVEVGMGETLVVNAHENGRETARVRGPTRDAPAECDLGP